MKAVITKVTYKDERDGKFGKMYNFEIKYNDKTAYYTSKSKDQKKFIEGQECEFTEESRESKKGNKYFVVKPIYQQTYKSNYGKALQREQSKYSGFACSYAKDLVVADKIDIQNLEAYTKRMFDLMVKLDKSIQQ